MADHHRCLACSASVPRRAGFCPACGTAVDAPPLLIEAASTVTEGRGHEVALGAGRANRKHSALAVTAVVVAVLGVGLAAGTGNGDSAGAPPSTLAPAVTTRPAPRYVAAPIPELGGAALYAIVDDHVVRIDTVTGEITAFTDRSRRAGGDWRNLIPRRGGVVVTADSSPIFFPDDASEPVDLGLGEALAANDPTLVWIWQGFRATHRFPVRLVRIDTGEEIARVQVPASAYPVGDDGTGRLVVAADGGSYTIDPDSGAIDRLSRGKLVAVTATHVVHLRCDERLACANELVDRASGSVVPIPADHDKRPGTCAQLAPTLDRLMATHFGDTVRLHVVDLDNGSRSVLVGMAGHCPSYSWTADGRHLVWATRGVTVWTVGSDQPLKYQVTDRDGHRATVAEVALRLPAT